jgi:hypothetical protein
MGGGLLCGFANLPQVSEIEDDNDSLSSILLWIKLCFRTCGRFRSINASQQ